MAFNYNRSQSVADKMITKYGMSAVLRRASGDRACTVVEADYTPLERAGKLVNPTDRLFLVDAKNLAIPPLFGVDILVTFVQPEGVDEDESLKIVQPPGRLGPAGVIVYWELAVRA